MNRKERREQGVTTRAAVRAAPAKTLTIYPNLDPRIELALNTLDGPGWRGVIVRSNKLLTQAVQNVQRRQGDDMVMANLFNQTFDLHAFALSAVAVDGFRAPMLIQEQTDRLSKHLWEGVYKTIRMGIEETRTLITAEESEKARVEIGHVSSAVDAAQADATSERRRADGLAAQVTSLQAQLDHLGDSPAELAAERQRTAHLSADLKRARQDAAKQIYDLQKEARQLKAARLAAEERAAQPSDETLTLRERVVQLERQNKKPTPPEVIRMSEPVLSHTTGSTLEALSLSAYARRQGLTTVVSGQTVEATTDLAPVLPAWQRDVYDHAAFLKSLTSVAAVRGARVA